MKANVKVLEYSEKCIAVIGDTKPIKEELKAIGGKFNPYLKHDGLTVAGWVFGLKRRNEVLALIGNEGEQVTPEPVIEPNEPVICGSNEPIIEPQPEPQRAEKIKVVMRGESERLKNGVFVDVIEDIPVNQFDPRLHYPVNGHGEIKVSIAPNADLSFTKPKPSKEKPFKAIFSGDLFQGEKVFKTAKELEKFVFELRNEAVGTDAKGRTIYRAIEGKLSVQFIQL